MASGCKYGPDSFACVDDASCGAGGKCEPAFNLCSFPDEAKCGPGGRSFGDLGGANSGQCVGCYGTAPISICFATPPTGARTYSGTIDTTNSPMCATNVVSGGSGFCVLAAGTIMVDARLRATGAKPLVLLATDSITTGATIDVGSHRGATPETGAGADPAACTTMAGTAPTNGGGGSGGSFAGQGGAGAVSAKAGSTGGMPGAAATSITLRGGCPGQDGEGTSKGTGGHGGGAVLLIATRSITLGGDILAGGEGGDAGSMNTSGGGGGGAGGMIWFDAPTVANTGNNLILASGGAGGEGSGNNTAGLPGADATTVIAAIGGSGGANNGGDGGNGSSGAAASTGASGSAGTAPMGLPGAGGAGGGGAGLVKARTGVNLGTRISPAMTSP